MELPIKKKPIKGEVRVIEKFLLFPRTLPFVKGGTNKPIEGIPRCYKRRWLERAKIVQEYQFVGLAAIYDSFLGGKVSPHRWVDCNWAD